MMVVDREGNSNWSYHVWRSRKPSSSFFNRIPEHNQEKISENDFAVRTFKTTLTFLWSFDAKYLSWQVRGAASQTKRLRCHSFLCVCKISLKIIWKRYFFWPFKKNFVDDLMCWFWWGFIIFFHFLCVEKNCTIFLWIYPNHWLSNPGYRTILRLSMRDFFLVHLLKCTNFFILEKMTKCITNHRSFWEFQTILEGYNRIICDCVNVTLWQMSQCDDIADDVVTCHPHPNL